MLMECNSVLCLAEERQTHCLLSEECKKNTEIKSKNYVERKKLCVSFVNIEKAFDRVPRKMTTWAMMKKGLIISDCRSSDEPLL